MTPDSKLPRAEALAHLFKAADDLRIIEKRLLRTHNNILAGFFRL